MAFHKKALSNFFYFINSSHISVSPDVAATNLVAAHWYLVQLLVVHTPKSWTASALLRYNSAIIFICGARIDYITLYGLKYFPAKSAHFWMLGHYLERSFKYSNYVIEHNLENSTFYSFSDNHNNFWKQ